MHMMYMYISDLPGVTSFKETDYHSSRSHHLPLAPQLGVGLMNSSSLVLFGHPLMRLNLHSCAAGDTHDSLTQE